MNLLNTNTADLTYASKSLTALLRPECRSMQCSEMKHHFDRLEVANIDLQPLS